MSIKRTSFRLAVAAVTMVSSHLGGQSVLRLTPVARRLTDEAFARDLSVFTSFERRAVAASASSTGTRKYLAARASEWIALSREAYERNDRTAFPEDMLALAEGDLTAIEGGGAVPEATLSSVLFPNNVRVFNEEMWGRAVALRRDADRIGAPDEIARAEATLIRAGHRILAGPACLADAAATQMANDRLLAVERTRVSVLPMPAPVPDPPQVVPDRPAPVPQPDSARLPRLPRGACDAPERLVGVASAVHFALDRHALSSATRNVLDRTIEQLRSAPGVRVRLSGHTDPRASNAYNQALSQRRVDAVIAYMAARGISGDRVLRAVAEGEERLLASGAGAADMARNRRVEIIYLLCDGSELVPVETLDDLQPEPALRRPKEK